MRLLLSVILVFTNQLPSGARDCPQPLSIVYFLILYFYSNGVFCSRDNHGPLRPNGESIGHTSDIIAVRTNEKYYFGTVNVGDLTYLNVRMSGLTSLYDLPGYSVSKHTPTGLLCATIPTPPPPPRHTVSCVCFVEHCRMET